MTNDFINLNQFRQKEREQEIERKSEKDREIEIKRDKKRQRPLYAALRKFFDNK